MSDVLVITGPVNAQQLDIDGLAPGTVVVYPYVEGTEIGSSAFMERTLSWLSGKNLRSALVSRGIEIDHLAVIWFSAGHGSIQSLLSEGTRPSDVDAWICIDGLYASWGYAAKWASSIAKSSMAGETTLLVTASKSTPGQYADGISAWKEVINAVEMPSLDLDGGAIDLGLPSPAEVWGTDRSRVFAFPDVDHAHQVPECRAGAMRLWQDVRGVERPTTVKPSPPRPSNPIPTVRDVGQQERDAGWSTAAKVGAASVGALALIGLYAAWRSG